MKIITTLFLIISSLSAYSQNFYNNGEILTIQPSATLYVEGDLQNQAGSQLINDGKIILKGNIINNQAMAGGNSGIWVFNGNMPQSIHGTRSLKVYNFEIDNTNGVTLFDTVITNGLIYFKNGIITTNALASPFVVADGGGISSVFPPTDISHINGFVRKEGDGLFTYPLGDGIKYQKITADITQNTLGLTAKYIAGDATTGSFSPDGTDPTPLTDYNNKEFWNFSKPSGGTARAAITVYWDGYNDVSVMPLINRRVANRYINKWYNEGNVATVTGNSLAGSITSNVIVNNFTRLTLGTITGALPLNLLSFTVIPENNNALLKWKTNNEINVSSFNIERSIDGVTFGYSGNVKTNATTGINSYVYTDYNVAGLVSVNAPIYYRLKMIDNGGVYKYSEIRKVQFNGSIINISKVWPNPGRGVYNISLANNANSSIIISLYNEAGQLIKTQIVTNTNNGIINLSSYPNGVYLLKTNTGETTKIIKN